MTSPTSTSAGSTSPEVPEAFERPSPDATPEALAAAEANGRRSASRQIDPRVVRWSAIAMVAALVVGVIIVAVTYNPAPAPPKVLSNSQVRAPEAIPQPESGEAPTDSGDRGGWEQLALMTLILVAVIGIGAVMLRGGGKAGRERRKAWMAAAESGRDGAIDELNEHHAHVDDDGHLVADGPLAPAPPA